MSMRGFHLFAHMFTKGLQDSIFGIWLLYRVDQDQLREQQRLTSQNVMEPSSTLARRRAERGHKPRTEQKPNEPRVLYRLCLCCGWNGGVFLLSIFAFHGFVLPCLQFLTHFIFAGSPSHYSFWFWIGPILKWTFGALWILPLFIISKVVNSLWFQDIADATYRHTRGRPQLPYLGKVLADILFSILLQSLFLIQGMSMTLLPIPILGQLISITHLCLLYSLYAFEYKWFNMGFEVQKRLSYIENNWPYFLGFGLPLTLLTSFLSSSFIINGAIFSILFPLFIISANETASLQVAFDFPLKLFAPVVSISNAIFRTTVKHGQASTPKKSSASSKRVTMKE